MQTLNLHDNHFSEFNAFRLGEAEHFENSKRGLILLEQLQTSLELPKLLNIFAMEAAKYVDFSGLYFINNSISVCSRGSRPGKVERQFELKQNDEFIGVLTYAVNSPISLTNYNILQELHHYLLFPLRNAMQFHHVTQLAMQDSLTGLGNRRCFDEQLNRAILHANRRRSRIGLILCDLNKFKSINDTYGHHIGDDVLMHFADALQESVRDDDSVFRFGGDEFAILVEDACDQSLCLIESRIHEAVANNALLAKYNVSCSVGVTYMNRADNVHSIFERADQELYRNKVNMPQKLSVIR